MRLPPMSSRVVDLLEKSRPQTGDIVATFDNERFIVEQVGMRYYVCTPVGRPNANKRWFRHSEVQKWTLEYEEQPNTAPVENPPIDLHQQFAHIGPRD